MRLFTRPRLLHPAQIVAFSYAAVIAAGTLLLSLPAASATGEPLPFLDALFTATSATCVTGLTVADTGTAFSRFGQTVILLCFQVGALGLMAFTTIFLVMLDQRLGIADRLAVEESLYGGRKVDVATTLKYIVAGTLAAEFAGAAILAGYWMRSGRFESAGETVYQAVFHAVSAFCNAGFGLFADSLIRFQDDGLVVAVITGLIVVGGIGFLVLLDVKQYAQLWWWHYRAVPMGQKRALEMRPRPRLSLHSKFMLLTSAGLLAIGTVSYFILEREGAFAGMSGGQAWMNAWFASVTARTAGFNTVDYGHMGAAALLCTMVLMFIGGGPGSTAGGIKASTFGLLIAYAWSRWRGQGLLNAFGRTVPREARDRAGMVVVASVALVVLGGSALVASETRGLSAAESHAILLPVIFDTISAFGTVGLSMGYTPSLTDAGKVIMMVLMFLGRVGPLTLALAISRRERPATWRHAEESIMVG
jgi:trk system potassium uptake protein TrkH